MTDHQAITTAANQTRPIVAEGTIMIILERDGSLTYHPPKTGQPRTAQTTLKAATAAELPSPSLIERIISVAFDLLGVHRLEVRIDES
ncbi:MAG: hypothetical protein D6823_00365 [Chloroflexi bacterium]|jgi:hypothetical protein|nr:MAG: hypothetical protein D6823_00365 [Chloroflexota bacterium]